MILVLSHSEDAHAERVLECLARRGADALLMNLADFPDKASLSLCYGGQGCHAAPIMEYRTSNGETLDLSRIQSVWWRRPQAPDLAGVTNLQVEAFTRNEWQECLNGLWQLLDVPWMNPPALDDVASRKLLQLKVATEVGLRVPRTLVTSDPEAARRFLAAEGLDGAIFKSFSCTYDIWRETRLVQEADLLHLDKVKLSPVIFQEYIHGGADFRVTIVGDRVFAAAIDATRTDYPVDFRMSLGKSNVYAVELPTALVDCLLALMERLGLVYGAIDLKQTAEGEYVFLEVNTAGEFLFVEARTGQPIADAVAGWLAEPVARRPSALAGRAHQGTRRTTASTTGLSPVGTG